MTQTDLAKRLRTSYDLPFHQQTVQRIESGERPVRLDEAYLIAEELDADLATMVSTSTPDADEMRLAVDRLRRGARSLGEDLNELASDFVELLEALHYQVYKSAGDAEVPEEPLDPVTKWGMGWATLGGQALKDVFELVADLEAFAGGDPDKFVLSAQVLDVQDRWAEYGLTRDVSPGDDMTPSEFYALLGKEATDVEHQEEV